MTAIETMIQATLAQHPEIRLAILFGSLATGDGHHESDVDLAIDAGLPLEMQAKMSLMAEIAESTGRPVDLIDLRTIGEPLLGQILKHGKRLLGENAAYAELIKRHLFDEADFMPYYRGILRERRSAWIGK
ncbi:MAG: nucleotidyltransferase domain-containing protein [Sulfurimicrobium sp.]|nr:nucleotidyltransferase domain-containing protein [Sulfurimicrobium sp.]